MMQYILWIIAITSTLNSYAGGEIVSSDNPTPSKDGVILRVRNNPTRPSDLEIAHILLNFNKQPRNFSNSRDNCYVAIRNILYSNIISPEKKLLYIFGNKYFINAIKRNISLKRECFTSNKLFSDDTLAHIYDISHKEFQNDLYQRFGSEWMEHKGKISRDQYTMYVKWIENNVQTASELAG